MTFSGRPGILSTRSREHCQATVNHDQVALVVDADERRNAGLSFPGSQTAQYESNATLNSNLISFLCAHQLYF